MGMIFSIKVGYIVTLLEKRLSIFDIEGEYLSSYAERKNQSRGFKGIGSGGKLHLLRAMRILKPICEDNEGKYSIVGGIKRCWRKADILPVS